MKVYEDDDDLDEYFLMRDTAMQRKAGACLRTPWCSCYDCTPNEEETPELATDDVAY